MTAASSANVPPPEIRELRAAHYNATVTDVVHVHADLRILRVVPDAGMPAFEAGQFMTLGLGNWEPRVEGVDEEYIDAVHYKRLAKRAYSISCSLIGGDAIVRRANELPYLEFYVALVRHAERRPPSLTPRLFALHIGGRLFVEPRAAGKYTLHGVEPVSDVFFFASGTGEAPHNAMIAELLARGHRGRIVSVVSVRYLRDAAYLNSHQRLMQWYPHYQYFVLATRETTIDPPSNVIVNGRYHLQQFVSSGELERRSGIRLDPANCQIFLCGNADMIGTVHRESAPGVAAKAGSMLDMLLCRGFRTGDQANVHFECY